MAKYKVTLEMKETYVLFVEARSEDAAIALAGDTDLGNWNSISLLTQSVNATEIAPVTEEGNI